jgi:hypothetical protein
MDSDFWARSMAISWQSGKPGGGPSAGGAIECSVRRMPSAARPQG